MDFFILKLRKRILLPIVFAIALTIWFVLCRAFYQSYWDGTIFRVQTVDFNLLHHTLPNTLSQLIIAGRDDLIQNVLDASYGLFGLVVTDPSGQSILYHTQKIYHRRAWQKALTPEGLIIANKEEPFDWLTDPPPLEAAYTHPTPRSFKAESAGIKPEGRVLGRIYYIRDVPPSLSEDMNSFISSGFWELSGSKRGYLFISSSTIGFSLVILLLIWLRRKAIELKQKEVEYVCRQLEIQKKALEQLTTELANQKARKSWLEKESDQSYRRALSLKQALERLRKALTVSTLEMGDDQFQDEKQNGPKVRPPVHAPSTVLEELENFLPDLTKSAGTLKAQADLLQEYCAILETRQKEIQDFLEETARHGQGQPLIVPGQEFNSMVSADYHPSSKI